MDKESLISYLHYTVFELGGMKKFRGNTNLLIEDASLGISVMFVKCFSGAIRFTAFDYFCGKSERTIRLFYRPEDEEIELVSFVGDGDWVRNLVQKLFESGKMISNG